MQLTEPRKVKENSVVLIRNIANESKREPMKLARIVKINDSRDETQRILTLTYNNIKQRKDGTWIGTPMTVERSINDIIPVDKALNESMLNPSILANKMNNYSSKSDSVASNDETNGVASNDETDGVASIDETNSINEVEVEDKNMRCENITINDEKGRKKDTDVNDSGISTIQKVEDGDKNVRRSERIRKQRYEIHPDDIGNNDDEKDENYKR